MAVDSTASARKPLGLIFLTTLLDLLGLTLIIPILAPLLIESELVLGPGVDKETRNLLFGLVVATFPALQFMGAPLLGALSDRVGRKRVLYLTISGSLISYLITAIGITRGDIVLLFLGRAVQGFSAGNLSVIYSAIADISSKDEKARNFGLVGAAFGIGFVIGPLVGGILSDSNYVSWFSFATPFWVSAGLVGINLLLVWAIFPETLKEPNLNARITPWRGFENLARAATNPQLRSIFGVVFLFTFGFTFFTQMIQLFLIERFSFNQSDIGKLFGYVGVLLALTQGLIVRYLSRRVSPAPVLRITVLILAGSFLLLLIPDSTLGIYLMMPFIVVSNGIANPNLASTVSNLAPAHLQGETLGMQQSVQSLAQIVPPIAGGVIVSYSITSPMWLASMAVLLAWLLFVWQFGWRGVINPPT
jgi:MFS transporter, DHA1 family, tetracycline resistance protein